MFAERDIYFNAVKIHEVTDKMYSILNDAYKEVAKREISFARLGNSTAELNFYLTKTISNSISAS